MSHLVIFVCKGNIHRSVVAEFAARQLLAEHGYHDIHVESRGLQWYMDGPPLHKNLMDYPEAWENSRATLEKYEIDLSHHVAKVLSSQDMKQADIVIVMDQELLRFTCMKFPEYKNKIRLFSNLIEREEDIRDLGEHATSGDYQSAIVNILTMLQQGIPRLISWLKVTPRG